MSDKSLSLLIQSSRDALAECLNDLTRAVEAVDVMDRRGQPVPFRPSQLERARAQCVAAHRMLEDLARKVD